MLETKLTVDGSCLDADGVVSAVVGTSTPARAYACQSRWMGTGVSVYGRVQGGAGTIE